MICWRLTLMLLLHTPRNLVALLEQGDDNPDLAYNFVDMHRVSQLSSSC